MRDYKEALGAYLSLYNFFKRLRKIWLFKLRNSIKNFKNSIKFY
jgi:hypothetical protein